MISTWRMLHRLSQSLTPRAETLWKPDILEANHIDNISKKTNLGSSWEDSHMLLANEFFSWFKPQNRQLDFHSPTKSEQIWIHGRMYGMLTYLIHLGKEKILSQSQKNLIKAVSKVSSEASTINQYMLQLHHEPVPNKTNTGFQCLPGRGAWLCHPSHRPNRSHAHQFVVVVTHLSDRVPGGIGGIRIDTR